MSESTLTEDETTTRLLTLDNVSQSFGDVAVLDDISVTVSSGTMMAIIGPNGSGKTTLSQIIAGLSRPSEGQVLLSAENERSVGYLPQNPQFRPTFTVEETLTFYANLLTTAVDVETTMDDVGLLDVRDRRVDALSGGMRRLLGLAQSLLGSPPLIVLDEPTSGLDPRMTRRIYDVASTRVADGTTVLLTTHDLTHAAEADELLLLHHGQVVARGRPDAIVDQTSTESLAEAFFSIVGKEPTVQSGVREGSR
ncbi:ABC transporter ATP-binding protein [halophilic archaeon]|nr:ABC transporter ATP-binding protein [halophilic archaeon]